MISPDEYLDALRAEGLTVVTRAGWKTWNTGGTWTPAGVITHHTGPFSTVAGINSLLLRGRADLPGPLCQASCAPDGTIHLIAWGAANHAGAGDLDVLAAVSHDKVPPAPNDSAADATPGNRWFYGLEAVHPGDSTPWPRAQYDAMVRYNAAICRLHGWTANRAIFHKGWTRRKVDPAGLDIAPFRNAIAARLAPRTTPPGAAPTDGGEMFQPKLVQVAGQDAMYVTTLHGASHVKNRTHLNFLIAGGVPAKPELITAAQLAALLEKEPA